MKMINDTDFVRQKWKYEPAFSTADTSFISDLYCTTTSTSIAEEIDRRIKQTIKEHEMRGQGIKFNDLEKDLKELGVVVSTIRQSGDSVCEIKGFFNPSTYKAYNAREKLTGPAAFKKPIPKKVIFSGPATTILWTDGTKTTVKCSDEDAWSDDVGIAMCYLKKMLGNKGNFNNIFREAAKVSDGCGWGFAKVNSSQVPESESYYSSALDSMKRNIDEINDFMKDAADALDKALGGKK